MSEGWIVQSIIELWKRRVNVVRTNLVMRNAGRERGLRHAIRPKGCPVAIFDLSPGEELAVIYIVTAANMYCKKSG